jgi:ribosomal protein S18 acetylase RimI-like enzyme
MTVPETGVTIAVAPPASPQAQQALRAYYHDIVERYYQRPTTEAEIDEVLVNEPSDDLQPPAGWLWVATLDGQAVGCIGLRYVTEDGDVRVGELTRVYVSSAARRQGLGSKLLAVVEQQTRADGVTSLRLDVRTDLVEARALYARHGFREAPAFNDSPYAGHWLRKALG